MPKQQRTVLLADMNAFYASVEQVLNPALQNQAVIVCGDPNRRHGIVLAASYEAKQCGVKTGMTVHQAQALCPDAHLVPPHMNTYIRFSTHIIQILHQFSPLVEPFSIDEAFVELTGCEALFGDGATAARHIKERIYEETGIRCSIGVAPNKLLAKMAADLQKPDGLTILTKKEIPDRLWPLPVTRLFGVGPRMEQHFRRMGIRTIGDLAHTDPSRLERRFGIRGRVLYRSAHGIDPSPVDPHTLEESKSIGHQFTLPRDYATEEEIRIVLRELAEEVGSRARQANYMGRTVTLTLRSAEWLSMQRSLTLPRPTNIGRSLFQAAFSLFIKHWDRKPIRALGISLSQLSSVQGIQLDLFGQTNKDYHLARAIDTIRKKYGTTSIRLANSLTASSVFTDRAEKVGGHQR